MRNECKWLLRLCEHDFLQYSDCYGTSTKRKILYHDVKRRRREGNGNGDTITAVAVANGIFTQLNATIVSAIYTTEVFRQNRLPVYCRYNHTGLLSFCN